MIQLTKETKTVDKETTKSKIGDTIDYSLYLVRVDSNNLALKRGDRIENYFGDVRTALKRSLNYAIKGSETELTLNSILETVKHIDEQISKLTKEVNIWKRIEKRCHLY